MLSNYTNDHTKEVEQRIAAIRILVNDSCIFFKPRIGSTAVLQQCLYCAYAVWDTKQNECKSTGLCKYKR
ncbi:hypothetical protein SDC9_155838 [bioreactor metagenome]|uniref:Uncharacterized protein n=1 Tax=bioreactor metagenome TaxID=1076179 RepID=A0A645F2K6_9ZZZZ